MRSFIWSMKNRTSQEGVACARRRKSGGKPLFLTCSFQLIQLPFVLLVWLKTDDRVRSTFDVQRINKPNVSRLRRHHD